MGIIGLNTFLVQDTKGRARDLVGFCSWRFVFSIHHLSDLNCVWFWFTIHIIFRCGGSPESARSKEARAESVLSNILEEADFPCFWKSKHNNIFPNCRQEHIYEFIITEKHHCQLLKVTITHFFNMLPALWVLIHIMMFLGDPEGVLRGHDPAPGHETRDSGQAIPTGFHEIYWQRRIRETK